MQTVWTMIRTGAIVLVTVFTLFLGMKMANNVYQNYFAMPAEVNVPTVVLDDKGSAEKALDRAGLKMDVRETRFQPKVPADHVISQDPPGGHKVRTGREVSVVISRGPETDNVPDVTGMTLRDARLALENAKLRVGKIVRRAESDTKSEEVLEQKPAAGTAARKGSKVSLIISMGGKSAVTIPNYEGSNIEEVRDRIEADGLKIGTVSWVIDPKAPVGEVVRQNPGPRVALAADSAVEFVVSAGNDPRDLEVHRTMVEYLVPAGPQNQAIRFDVNDSTGTNTVYESSLSPGQKVDVEVTSMGDGDLMIYSNDRLIKREEL